MVQGAYHPEFDKAGKKIGIQIWRVENLEPVPIPNEQYGNFFTGDCYIVLKSEGRPNQNPVKWNLHFWIGKESSQDEQGAAAILSTQMDDHMGGEPTQYREVQNNEGDVFKNYFKNGIIYKKGGVASGFRHATTNSYEEIKRLLHVKGRKKVVATEVEMSWSSINVGDVFLLDLGNVIIQWNGPKSNRMERLKGCNLAKEINSRERSNRAKHFIVEGGEENATPKLKETVANILGKKPTTLSQGEPDEIVSRQQKSHVKLFHVSDQSGQLVMQEVATKPLTQDLLNHDDCYILDHGASKIYVWKGKKASKEERSGAMARAMGYIKAKQYPMQTQIETVNDGGESAMFKQLFKSWKSVGDTIGRGKMHSRSSIAKIENKKFDANMMHNQPKVAAQERMCDDGKGEKIVYRIEQNELAEVNAATYGQFYGGDCYIVFYTYMKNNKPSYLLYYWMGRHATQDERAACAFQATMLDQKYNDEPVQIRVQMGKEPRHFLAMFGGKLIIHEGGTSRKGGQSAARSIVLYQVRGTNAFNTKAIEVPAKSTSLNSNDVFIVKAPAELFVWCGKGSNGDEREMAKTVAATISKLEYETIPEGSEPPSFWALLGGQMQYASSKSLQEDDNDGEARLFECSNQTGTFKCEEMTDFTQDDLDSDDVMMLDSGSEIYIWVGEGANKLEKDSIMATAVEYLKTDPSNRDEDTPIITVKQGFEPPTFTGWFGAWDPQMWSGGKSYEEIKKSLGGEDGFEVVSAKIAKTVASKKEPAKKYTYQQLTQPADGLPSDVDPLAKEDHLTEEEFKIIMGISRIEFQGMAKWKQNNLKKAKNLF